MSIAPLPAGESRRLAKLHDFGVLDTLPEQAFEDITALASAICGTPITTVGGLALGTVCVADREARQLNDHQRRTLQSLSSLVLSLLERDRQHQAHARREAVEAERRLEYLTAASLT